ncbi:unnamed protein product, partial [Caretta caretta]
MKEGKSANLRKGVEREKREAVVKHVCTSQQCKKQKEAESTVEQRADSMGYANIDAFEGVYTSHSK